MADTTTRPLLVALGDSITAGVGGKWNRGYPEHLRRLLQADNEDYQLINWGIPGLTMTRLRKTLHRGAHLYDTLARARYLVMTIGGNDLMKSLPRHFNDDMLRDVQNNTALIRELELLVNTIRSVTNSPLFIGNLYNPFPQSQLADLIIQKFNKVGLEPLAKRYKNVHVVRVYDALKGKEAATIQYYKTGDVREMKKIFRTPVHPNDDGHLLIAELFYQQIKNK